MAREKVWYILLWSLFNTFTTALPQQDRSNIVSRDAGTFLVSTSRSSAPRLRVSSRIQKSTRLFKSHGRPWSIMDISRRRLASTWAKRRGKKVKSASVMLRKVWI